MRQSMFSIQKVPVQSPVSPLKAIEWKGRCADLKRDGRVSASFVGNIDLGGLMN